MLKVLHFHSASDVCDWHNVNLNKIKIISITSRGDGSYVRYVGYAVFYVELEVLSEKIAS